jgi:hypothetical protein
LLLLPHADTNNARETMDANLNDDMNDDETSRPARFGAP